METSYYIRNHEFKKNADGCGTDICIHCGSRAGIGFHYIHECELRFNTSGFRQYLDFKNISYANATTGLLVKRFTNETFKTKDLMEEFKNACSKEATDKVINEKYIAQNAL